MYSKYSLSTIVALIVILLTVFAPSTPTIMAAGVEYVDMQKPFTVDPDQDGYLLQTVAYILK
jgi:hypothetical protein